MSVIRSTVIDRTPESPTPPVAEDPYLNLFSASPQYSTEFQRGCQGPDGNFYVATSYSNYKFGIIKYSPAGEIIWQKKISPLPADDLTCWSFTAGADGYLYIFCRVVNYQTYYQSGSVIKIDQEGTIISQILLRDLSDNNVYLESMAVDSLGNMYVSGENPSSNVTVIKINAAGNTVVWQKTFVRTDPSEYNFDSHIKIGFDDKIYLAFTRYINVAPYVGVIHLTKMDLDGTVLWERQTSSPDQDSDVYDIMVSDTTGSIYTVGNTYDIETYVETILLVKYDPGGNILWHKIISSPVAYADSYAESVMLDSDDNVYVVGVSPAVAANQDNVTLMKFDSSGSLLWQGHIETGGLYPDQASYVPFSVAVSGDWLYFFFWYYDNLSNTIPAINLSSFFCRVPTDGTGLGWYNPQYPTVVPAMEYFAANCTITTGSFSIAADTMTKSSTINVSVSASSYTIAPTYFSPIRFLLDQPPPDPMFKLLYQDTQYPQYMGSGSMPMDLLYTGTNFYTSMSLYDPAINGGSVVIKYGPDGSIMWEKSFISEGDLTVGLDGLFYYAVWDFTPNPDVIIVHKFDSDGDILATWQLSMDFSPLERPSIRVNQYGFMYLAASINGAAIVCGIDRDGVLQWQKAFYGNQSAYPCFLEINRQNEIYFAMSSTSGVQLMRLNPYDTGEVISCVRLYTNTGSLRVSGLHAPNYGRLYVDAYIENGGFYSYDAPMLMAFDSSLNLLWKTNAYDNMWQSWDVAVDIDNNVYFIAYNYFLGFEGGAAIMKFDSSGSTQWSNRIYCQSNVGDVFPNGIKLVGDWLYLAMNYNYYSGYYNYSNTVFGRVPADGTSGFGWYYLTEPIDLIYPLNYGNTSPVSTARTVNTEVITASEWEPETTWANISFTVSTIDSIITIDYELDSKNWFDLQATNIEPTWSSGSERSATGVAIDSQGLAHYTVQDRTYRSADTIGIWHMVFNPVGENYASRGLNNALWNRDVYYYPSYAGIGLEGTFNDIAVDGSYAYMIVDWSRGVVKRSLSNYDSIVWQKRLFPWPSMLQGIDVDESGNVYLVAYLESVDKGQILKLDSSGSVVWAKDYPEPSGGYRSFDPRAVRVVSSGDVFVLVNYEHGGYICSAVLKHDSSGNLLWNSVLANGGLYGYAMVIGASGNIYVAGFDEGIWPPGMMIYALDSTGTLLWDRRIQGANAGLSIDVDQDENVYVVGSVDSGDGTNLLVVKYDNLGSLLWQRETSGTELPTYSNFYGYSIKYSDSQIFIAGTLLISYNAQCALYARLDATTGSQTGTYTNVPEYLIPPAEINYVVSSYPSISGTSSPVSVSLSQVLSSYSLSNTSFNNYYYYSTNALYEQRSSLVSTDHWITTYGWTNPDNYSEQESLSISVDANKNTYTSVMTGYGSYYSTVPSDILVKQNSKGQVLWEKILSTNRAVTISKSVVDASGNIYLWCQLQGNYSTRDAGLIKLDPDGNSIWDVKSFRDVTYNYPFWQPYDITLDDQGNVYVTGEGSWWGVIVFKFNASGVRQWYAQAPSPTYGGYGVGISVAVDSNHNVFLAASDYDSPSDAGLIKFDSSGALVWQKSLGYLLDNLDPWYYYRSSVEVSATTGDIYVSFTATDGAGDIWGHVGRYDTNGNKIWARKVRGSGDEFTSGPKFYQSALDDDDNLYVVGRADFYGDIGPYQNIILIKYNSDGDLLYQRQITSSPYTESRPRTAYDVKILQDKIYISGTWAGDSSDSSLTLVLPTDGTGLGDHRGYIYEPGVLYDEVDASSPVTGPYYTDTSTLNPAAGYVATPYDVFEVSVKNCYITE